MPAAGYPLHRAARGGHRPAATRCAPRAPLLLAARATGRARRLLRAHRRRRGAGRRRLRGRAGRAGGAHAAAAAGADRGRQPPRGHEPAAGAVCAAGVPGVSARGARRARNTSSPGGRFRRAPKGVIARPLGPGLGVAPDVALRARVRRLARCPPPERGGGRRLRLRGAGRGPARLRAARLRGPARAARRARLAGRTTGCSRTSSRSRTRWRPPTWPSPAPAARCSSWRPRACPRSSFRTRTRRPTTRPRTRASWSGRAPRW